MLYRYMVRRNLEKSSIDAKLSVVAISVDLTRFLLRPLHTTCIIFITPLA